MQCNCWYGLLFPDFLFRNLIFQSSCGTARWTHILKVWRINASGKYKLAWKLRAAHVFLSSGGKMSVKLAAHVISRSLAVGKSK